ncbi:MAG TPA: glycoside hydrolase family 15 protein [Streptosporangiaceae bacterium]
MDPNPKLQYSTVTTSKSQSDLTTAAPYLFWLMFRNVASDGFVFDDPARTGVVSAPGCVLASPSWENTQTHVAQDYVYNWTRDAAVVAIELANGTPPSTQPLADYVQFAQMCQNSGSNAGHFDRGSFLINGAFRDGWTDQTDGPALQTLAILQLYGQLDDPAKATADAVIAANLGFLENAYQGETFNIWEEEYGYSFFARAVQLKCFQQITANTLGIPVPGWLAGAIGWLQTAVAEHWNPDGGYYQSLIPAPAGKAPYDPNSDIVMAAIYGAVAVTDTRLLATAALLRNQWSLASSPYYYPINGADQQRGIGPMMGRYPADVYDGDNDQSGTDHPWAICTCNFAELYYRLAREITAANAIPLDANSAGFFDQVAVTASSTPATAAAGLRAAGDQMLQAIVFHSDHLELSEQFDATTGYEKSVSNLSWSYASFLSAIRAR